MLPSFWRVLRCLQTPSFLAVRASEIASPKFSRGSAPLWRVSKIWVSIEAAIEAADGCCFGSLLVTRVFPGDRRSVVPSPAFRSLSCISRSRSKPPGNSTSLSTATLPWSEISHESLPIDRAKPSWHSRARELTSGCACSLVYFAGFTSLASSWVVLGFPLYHLT